MSKINNFEPCLVIDLLQVAYGNNDISEKIYKDSTKESEVTSLKCGKCACSLLVSKGVITEGSDNCYLIENQKLTLPDRLNPKKL